MNDTANTRDLRFVITDDAGFVSDETTDADSDVTPIEAGIPGYDVRVRCRRGRYELEKTVVSAVDAPVVLLRARVAVPSASGNMPRLHLVLTPRVGQETSNDGWVGSYKGVPMLFARGESAVLALACSSAFARATG